jgi:hypothetical protein
MDALEKPEPRGRARALVNGAEVQATQLRTTQRDTLTPIWEDARFIRVPLNPTPRIELELYDKDLVNDDAMGTPIIVYSDLVAALRSGTLFHVPVADQTNNQVLFMDVLVEPAS